MERKLYDKLILFRKKGIFDKKNVISIVSTVNFHSLYLSLFFSSLILTTEKINKKSSPVHGSIILPNDILLGFSN